MRKSELETRRAVLALRKEVRAATSLAAPAPQPPTKPGEIARTVEIVAALKGETGERGAQGETGPQGESVTGPRGERGIDGTPGAQGERGIDGARGPQGFRGLPGTDGKDGARGIDGARGDKGDAGDPGIVWRGDFKPGTRYAKGDAVASEGSSWIAVRETIAQPTADHPEWDLVARKGTDGYSGWSGEGGGTTLTLEPVGTAPAIEGASLLGGALTLQPADATFPGLVSILAQTFAGLKTFAAGIALAARLTFTGIANGVTHFQNSVANTAAATAFIFDNTVTLATAGAKLWQMKNNGVEVISLTNNSTYNEPTLTIPTPTSTVACIKFGAYFISQYGTFFQFGTTPSGANIGLQAASLDIPGGYSYNGNLNGTNVPVSIAVAGAYAGGSSVGIGLFGAGSTGGALGRGVMAGVAAAAPAADFPVFAVCTNMTSSAGYPAADVGGYSPTFLARMTGDGKLALLAGPLSLESTDSSGAPGAVTINKASGRAAIAIGASTVVVTCSKVAAGDQVIVTGIGRDATCRDLVVDSIGAGTFTVSGNANATAATKFSFLVIKAN